MAEVIDITQNEPHFNVLAVCLNCLNKWIGTVHYKIGLFTLECPKCGEQDSFASVLPHEYIDTHKK
jgi:hypothetical protein